MCGIMAYIGSLNAFDVVTRGLIDLSPRGYEGSGLVYIEDGELKCERRIKAYNASGSVINFPHLLLSDWHRQERKDARMVLGHNRAVTSGKMSLENTHPFVGNHGRIAMVHNGTISNADAIRKDLISQGVTFVSKVDSEVAVQLVEQYVVEHNTLYEAVQKALKLLEGSWAFVFVDQKDPSVFVCTTQNSPLKIGLSDSGTVIASEDQAIRRITNRVVDMRENELFVISAQGIDNQHRTETRPIEVEPDEIECLGYDHLMMKEIMEQDQVILRALKRGERFDLEDGCVRGQAMTQYHARLSSAHRVVLVGCGTAYHAALVARTYFRELSGIAVVEACVASEVDFSLMDPSRTVAIFISQSGETADVIRAIKDANLKGILTLGVVNRPGSVVSQITHSGMLCYAGAEYAVASTKAFVAQLTILYCIAVQMGRQRIQTRDQGISALSSILNLSRIMHSMLTNEDFINLCNSASQTHLIEAEFVAFIGSGMNYALALEGALKFQEITYIPANGYPSGELKHGPLAVLAKKRPVIALLDDDETYTRVKEYTFHVDKAHCPLVIITDETRVHDLRAKLMLQEIAGTVIGVPKVDRFLTPILKVVPLQLMAYFTASALGKEIDKPRNLSKTVTTV